MFCLGLDSRGVLQDFQRREREALAASQPVEAAEHEEVVREYGSFLLNVTGNGRIQLAWPQAERCAPKDFHLLHNHILAACLFLSPQ